MSQVIAGEADFFLASFLMGVCILLGYDFLRSLRRGVPHSGCLVSVQDFLYWCGAGVAIFYTAYRKNSGNIRWFAFAALLMGMVLYYRIVSPWVVRGLSFCFLHLYRWISAFFALILSPAGKSAKKLKKFAEKALKKHVKEIKIMFKKK